MAQFDQTGLGGIASTRYGKTTTKSPLKITKAASYDCTGPRQTPPLGQSSPLQALRQDDMLRKETQNYWRLE